MTRQDLVNKSIDKLNTVKEKASMRAIQKQLRSLIEYHFREAGGYKKVLCDSFLVAPPLFLGENSPREFQ